MKKIFLFLFIVVSLYATDYRPLIGAGIGTVLGQQFKHHPKEAAVIGSMVGAYLGSFRDTDYTDYTDYSETTFIGEDVVEEYYSINPVQCYDTYYDGYTVYSIDEYGHKHPHYIHKETRVYRKCR